jgi:threonylcarbamoyladenosine tRNA methylthiotransferase MtaB
MERSYYIATLGCKLNQFDSAAVEGRLQAAGCRRCDSPETAAIIVVNTCTVTVSADAQSRRLVRRLRRESPDCTLIVMGCSTERDPEHIRAAARVDGVFGTSRSEEVARFALSRFGDIGSLPNENSCAAQEWPLPAFADRTRALLKVQEGCDLKCSYCIIPAVRGASRSLPAAMIEAQIRQLVDSGYREIVLTGVNTGDYGRDLSPQSSLLELLRRLVRIPGLGRLRLNSLEPRTISNDLVAFLAGTGRVAPHLQVPLQSGSDPVLRAMRRPYRLRHYARIVETLRNRIPDIALGADVIAGFPGETEADHRHTREFLADSPLNYLHLFPYSERPGTPAAGMTGAVPGPVKSARVRELRALSGRLNFHFRRSFLGRERDILVLGSQRPDGRWRALTDNYIDLGVRAEASMVNHLVTARLTNVTRADTLADLATT